MALRGHEFGLATHTAASGSAASVALRFRFEPAAQPSFSIRLGETGESPSDAYWVHFEGARVALWRFHQGALSVVGAGLFSIEAGMTHTATALLGGGSLDVSVDGERVVGVDEASPPSGHVCLKAKETPVLVDDVTIVFGTGTTHAAAPRPAAMIAAGPDVGPFVDGTCTGDVYLSGDEELTLQGGRYTVVGGSFHISGNARLHLLSGAVLLFSRNGNDLLFWGFHLKDNSSLEIDDARVEPGDDGGLLVVIAESDASVIVRDAAPWTHILLAGGSSMVSLEDVRLVTATGGQVGLSGNPEVDLRRVVLASISLTVPAGSTFAASGLRDGVHFPDFDLQRDLALSGIDYELRMDDVTLAPSLSTDGANEKGWLLVADIGAAVNASDSSFGKVTFTTPAGSGDLEVAGLRLAEPSTVHVGSIALHNVTVTNQWPFSAHGSHRLEIEDCRGVWLFLYDTVEAVVRQSEMNEFDPRGYTGTVTFEGATWKSPACEILEENDFVMRGTVRTDSSVRECIWADSSMTREFPVSVRTRMGAPVAGATVTATRGTKSVTGTTGNDGVAVLKLSFGDTDRLSPWTISGAGLATAKVDAFSSAPVVLSPRLRVRRRLTLTQP